MGIFDFLKVNQYKQKINKLNSELNDLKNKHLSMEQMTAHELNEEIIKQRDIIKELDEKIVTRKSVLTKIESDVLNKRNERSELKNQLVILEDECLMEVFGLFAPLYDFADSLTYKKRLENVRLAQKQAIKDKTAIKFVGNSSEAVDQAKKNQVKINQMLRSFNNECEVVISKVNEKNVQSIEKRMIKSFEDLNRLYKPDNLSLASKYLDLKLKELYLADEYEKKKQEEKEMLYMQRKREREEILLQQEIQTKNELLEKSITHNQEILEELREKLSSSSGKEENSSLEQQIVELETKINNRQKEKQELDYLKTTTTAGYVYVISNEASFGEDVVKIGVTRSLDPVESINELSSVSVPFEFKLIALMFSRDAYQLESELHQHFDVYRLNKLNPNKDFFNIPAEKIKEKLLQYDELMIDFKESSVEES